MSNEKNIFDIPKESAIDEPQWLSVHEISDYLHIKEASIQRWLREKHIPAYKIGRYWRFDKHEINTWIKSGRAADVDRGIVDKESIDE